KLLPFAAEMGNAAVRLQNGLCGCGAKTNDHFGRDRIDLPEEKWRAFCDFIVFRLAILRRAAFHYVADVNVLPLQAHGFDHLSQQFSGAANKWKALFIFIRARTFSNEYELSLGIAVAKDDAVARLVQPAAFAIAEVFSNFEQRVVFNFAFEKR